MRAVKRRNLKSPTGSTKTFVAAVFAIWFWNWVTPVVGDAIVVTRAMKASTIGEIFVDSDCIRVQLEIGSADLVAFKNLLPDEIYGRMKLRGPSYEERLDEFFEKDWRVRLEQGQPLKGQVTHFEERKRVQRDEITGKPLVIQPQDAETVVYTELRFPIQGQPDSVSITPPLRDGTGRAIANVGFVAYHNNLPVTEFRYLSAAETLDLDWQDCWYSRFRNPNLRRQFDSPISVFLYVEPFEVRKEIVIRPVDLQKWTNLDIDLQSTIPIADQSELKRQVAEFLMDKQTLNIDGRNVEGELDRIHFIRRTLRKTGVIYPDEDLPAVSATLGVIFVYPIESLPEQVSLTWDLFDEKIKQVPASATDEAGGFPWTLTPADPTLTWTNFLTNPTIPAMRAVPAPPPRSEYSLPLVTIVCILMALWVIVSYAAVKARPRKTSRLIVAGIALTLGLLCLPVARIKVSNPFAPFVQITNRQADEMVDSLLHNMYHAFDRRQEGLVYDQLEVSLDGSLLRDIYLQTRQQLCLAELGGAQVKIDQVNVLANKLVSLDVDGFDCRCSWIVGGTVGHWGHLHRRQLGYEADFRIEHVSGAWKITAMQVVDEIQPEVTSLD
jgi:hypothetical protein